MMDELKNMICDELKEIERKGELSAGDLDTVYKLIVAKEKLLRIEELEDDLGYSNGDWRASGTYPDRNSYGRHYVRGHYSRGRYSMDDGRRMIADSIDSMMDDDNLSMADRNALRRAREALR